MAEPTDTIDVGVLLSELGAEDSPRRRQLVSQLVEFALDRPVSELVDAGDIVEVLAAAVTADNASRVAERWLEPAWDRHRERTAQAGDTVGDAVPEPERAAIRKLLQDARLPKAAWAEGAVDPPLVRDLLAPVLQQTLLGFVRKLPGLGGGGEAEGGAPGPLGGLAGAFGKRALERAGKLADAGRGVLSGALDERVQQLAREFSRSALGGMRQALAERLESDEGKRLVGRIREQVFDRLLEAKVVDLMQDAETVPPAEARDVAAALVGFNAQRDFVQRAVREEVDAWLALEGARTAGELLEEAGLDDVVRRIANDRLDALLRAFFSTHGFAAWLGSPAQG
ncbi:MAG: hypothetical protein ACOCXM_05020 [Myxococcota bacterium]